MYDQITSASKIDGPDLSTHTACNDYGFNVYVHLYIHYPLYYTGSYVNTMFG